MRIVTEWLPMACVLCSENCGLEVQLEGRRLARIKGDRRHPTSAGYLCDKASHLDHSHSTATGERATHDPLVSVLTAADFHDPLAHTSYHKNVPVRIRKAAAVA